MNNSIKSGFLILSGTIGIVGPKRMDYEKVMDNLKVLKNSLDGILDRPKGETQMEDWNGREKRRNDGRSIRGS